MKAKNFINRIVNGGKELAKSILNGTLGRIFRNWAKENPVAAGAGVVAAGLGLAAVVVVGGTAIGVLAGGVGALGAAIAGIGGTIAAATGIASMLTGKSAGQLISGALNFAETIYSFNFQQTDEAINKEIDSTITALYGPAGEFLGKSIAGILVGGLFNPPKIQINIRTLSLAWNLDPSIRDDLLNEVSSLAHLGLTAFRNIVIKQAFMRA